MATAFVEDLKSKMVVKAVRNVKRGEHVEIDPTTGKPVSMYRPEIRLDLQRSRLMTESYKQTDGEPNIMRRAKALAHLLDNMKVYILDYERIVGWSTEAPEGLFHPIELNWQSPRRAVNSQEGWSLLDDAGRKELDEICAYWKGKCMSDRQQAFFGPKLTKYYKYEGTYLWSHLSSLGLPNYEDLFKTGLKGRIQKIDERLKEVEETTPVDYKDQKLFLQSAKMVLEAVVRWARRYSDCASEMAKKEKDPARKKELNRIAEACQQVPYDSPRSFLEQLQFFWFLHIVRYFEYSTLGIGIRIDYLMGPQLAKDMTDGLITREEAKQAIELLYVKFNELGLIYSPLVTSVYGGVASLQAITLGGTDVHGNDITNELTYICLEAAREMKMIEPSIVLRVNDKAPDKLYAEAINTIKTGIGYPSLFNDEAQIPMLESWGVPHEQAMGYSSTGCVYMEIPGANVHHRTVGYFVFPKCLYWALHQGVNPKTGEQYGARTPDPATFKSYEDLMNAYFAQVKFFMERLSEVEDISLSLYQEWLPRPYYSAILDGCIEKGKEQHTWQYPSMMCDHVITIGATNVADAITAVKKVVFEDKKISLPELITVMDKNWEGHEDLRQICLHAPKYGNDDPYADGIAALVQHGSQAAMAEVKNRFGYSYRGDGSAVSSTYGLAADTPATPDGRVDGGFFADSTLAPQPGADFKGPTAVLKSCAHIDPIKTYNHLLNQRFMPSTLEGPMGDMFKSYLKTWHKMRIPHVQFNIVDQETLKRAQANPQEYKDLVVRVAGYSAYFVDLTKGLQDHLMARTIQRF